MRRHSRARAPIALLTVAGLITPAPGFGSAQAPATAPTSATAPAKAGAPAQTAAPTTTAAGAKTATPGTAPPAEPDGGWPRAYLTPSGGRVLVFQPQIASWEGQKHMVAYAAVSYQAKGAEKAELGTFRSRRRPPWRSASGW